jgi:hypothetical protein
MRSDPAPLASDARPRQACAGAPPEHTPLGEWLRGASLHEVLRGLRAFEEAQLGAALRR